MQYFKIVKPNTVVTNVGEDSSMLTFCAAGVVTPALLVALLVMSLVPPTGAHIGTSIPDCKYRAMLTPLYGSKSLTNINVLAPPLLGLTPPGAQHTPASPGKNQPWGVYPRW